MKAKLLIIVLIIIKVSLLQSQNNVLNTYSNDSGKWGIKDKNNNVIVSPKYDYIGNFPNGERLTKVFVGKLDRYGDPNLGKYGLINKWGNEVVPLIYDGLGEFVDSDTIFIAFSGKVDLENEQVIGKFGAITVNNDTIIPFKYDYIFSGFELFNGKRQYFTMFNGNIAHFMGGEKSITDRIGYVNLSGEEVVACKYNSIQEPFVFIGETSRHNEPIMGKGKYGVIDHNGKLTIEVELDWYDDIRINGDSTIYHVYKGKLDDHNNPIDGEGKYGIISKSGAVILPLKYSSRGGDPR